MAVFDLIGVSVDQPVEFHIQALGGAWQMTLRLKKEHPLLLVLNEALLSSEELKIILPTHEAGSWTLYLSASKGSSKFQVAHPEPKEFVGHLLLNKSATDSLRSALDNGEKIIFLTGTSAQGLKYPNNLSVMLEVKGP